MPEAAVDQTDPEPANLGPKEVSEIIGVSASTISRWADVGFLEYVTTPAGRRRFRRSDVEALRRKMGFTKDEVA